MTGLVTVEMPVPLILGKYERVHTCLWFLDLALKIQSRTLVLAGKSLDRQEVRYLRSAVMVLV